MKTKTLAAVALVALTSCSAFKIRSEAGSMPGLPFYMKRGYQEQTTVLTRTWTHVTIELLSTQKDKNAKPTGRVESTGSFAISSKHWNEGKARVWRNGVVLDGTRDAGVLAQDLLQALCATVLGTNELILAANPMSDAPMPDGIDETVVSNETKLAHEVDYTLPLYFNVKAPAFGTAEGTVKLAEDGTLSEATAKVDASKLAEELPISEFLSEKVLGLAGVAALSTSEPEFKLTIQAKPQGYRFTLKRRYELPLHESAPDPQKRDNQRYATVPAKRPPIPWNYAPLTFADADSFVRSSLQPAAPKKETTPVLDISASIVKPKP